MSMSSTQGPILEVKKLWWRWNDGSLKQDLEWMGNRWKRLLLGEKCNESISYNWKETPQRWQLIQDVIDQYAFKSYLEIGCFDDECFNNIRCKTKVGVDPAKGGTVRKTSDDFFLENKAKFGCVFIDGLHTYEQVSKDIHNSLACLEPGGVILLHDCLPCDIGEQAVPREQVNWSGDVWKAIVEQRMVADVDTATCVADRGIGVILKRPNTDLLVLNEQQIFKKLKFQEYVRNHISWMRPKSYAEIRRFISGEGP